MTSELRELHRMTVNQLRVDYEDVFGEAARTRNKDFLVKRIAWRLQANSEGGLTERALRRAAELANESDLRIRAPKEGFEGSKGNGQTLSPAGNTATHDFPPIRDARLPPPNTVLTRRYKGRDISVTILEDGFDFEGATFRTLSAVAKQVTGSHCNGFAFFKI